VTITSAIAMSGTNGFINADKCATFQGAITLSGVGCLALCKNKCTLDNITLSGNKCMFDGGGFGTTTRRVYLGTGTDNMACNFKSETKTPDENEAALQIFAARCGFYNALVEDAGLYGFITQRPESKLINCFFQDSDSITVYMTGGSSVIIYGNNINTPSSFAGVQVTSHTDAIINSNIVNNSGTGINISNSGADSTIVAGNRINNTPTDSGTGSIVSNNEISAF
jgi:hypothetical protein